MSYRWHFPSTSIVRNMKERSYIMEAIDLLVNDAEPMKKPYQVPRWVDYLATSIYLLVYGLGVVWIVCAVIEML